MTKEELKRLRELCERATSGEWYWQNISYQFNGPDRPFAKTEYGIIHLDGLLGNDWKVEDREFIAAAREAVPKLIEEMERKSGAIDNISEALFSANKRCDSLKAEVERNAKNHSDWIADHTKIKEQRDLLAAYALAAISEAGIPTPEKGYIEEPHMLMLDIAVLRRQRDRAIARVEKLEKALKYYSNAKRRTVFDVMPMNKPTKMVLMLEADSEIANEALTQDDKEAGG